MNFDYSDTAREYRDAVNAFMVDEIYPNEPSMYAQVAEGDR